MSIGMFTTISYLWASTWHVSDVGLGTWGQIMAVTAAQLIAKVASSGVEQTKADLQSVGASANTAGGIFKSALGGPISIAASVAGKAFSFLKDQMTDGIKIAMAHQDVMAQTIARIKDTGGVAGVTAKAVDDLATSFSRTTKFSADTVQGGEDMLLTFTSIGKDVFPSATKAMVEMAQVTGQSMPSAATMLGKAMDDPIQGISALHKYGVSFNNVQKQLIKTYVEHGQTASAQKEILKILAEQGFGNAAEAAGHTLGGALAILKNNLDDLKRSVADHVLPIFQSFVEFINNKIIPGILSFFTAVSKNAMVKSALKDIGDVMFQVGEVLKPLGGLADIFTGKIKDVTGKASPLLAGLSKDFHGMIITIEKDLSTINLRPFVSAVQDFMSHIDFKQIASGFGQVFGIIQNASPAVNLVRDLASHAQELGQWFRNSVVPALNSAQPGFASLGKALAGLLPAFTTISGVISSTFSKALNALFPIFEKAVPIIIQLAGYIANGLGQAIKFITPYVVQAAKELGKFADDIISRVAPIISHFFDGVKVALDFFHAHWSQIWGIVGPILKGAWDGIVGIIKTAWALASGLIKLGLDMMTGNWKHAWQDLQDMLSGAWDGIKGIIQGGLEIINGVFAGLPGRALQWGENMISSFIQGIQNMLGGVASAAQNVMATVENFIGVHSPTKMGPGRTLDQWGINLVKQFTNDIRAKTPEARLAAEDMMRQIQTAISGATTQLNMAKLSGNVAGQLAAKNTLFDLNAQMSQYQNVVKGAGYSYNAKDRTSPIGFGGQTMDQMVALAGVNKFTKDIASTTTGAHKDAQSLFSGLLKSLDGFAMKIAIAQLQGNSDLVNKLQAQQTTQQTQLSIFQMLAAKKGLTLDETNMNAPISSFHTPTGGSTAPSSAQYQFLGSRNQGAPMVVHVHVPPPTLDGRILANGLMPHITNAIRYNIGGTM